MLGVGFVGGDEADLSGTPQACEEVLAATLPATNEEEEASTSTDTSLGSVDRTRAFTKDLACECLCHGVLVRLCRLEPS